MSDGTFLPSVLTGTPVALLCGHSHSGLEPAKPATATPFTDGAQEWPDLISGGGAPSRPQVQGRAD